MGTSSMYTGPSGNPLLPDDFEDTSLPDSNDNTIDSTEENQNENLTQVEQQNIDKKKWIDTKTYMSRNASGKSNNIRKAVSNYVKAYGGAKKTTKSAVSGIRSTANFGQFLSNSFNQGIRETLDQYQIIYEGRSAKAILSDLLNVLAPVPVTKEDSVARKALIRTMEVLYEKIDDDANNINTLENISKDVLNEIIPIQIESYIYERIINDLGSRIEINSSSTSDAIELENEIKEYIQSKVETTLKGKDFSIINFNQNSTKEVDNLYNQCYKVMEDML